MSINAETRFYLTKGIMTLEEAKKLDNDREFLDYSLLIGDSTEDQLYKQIKIEMDIFHKCYAILKKENKNDKHSLFLLLMLFDRINNMFSYMFHLFPVTADHALAFIDFCTNNRSFISNRSLR